MTWKGRWYTFRHRAENRAKDVLAILLGYCNHCPWDVPGDGGGYSFWRCGLRRGHDGLHRFNNYVWDKDGKTSYVPIPYKSGHRGHQPWDRRVTHSRKQQRQLDEWHRERDAERRLLYG